MRLYLFVLGCLLHAFASADGRDLPPNLHLHNLNVNGDTINHYRQVVRHKNGYLWIATQRALERYDGYKLKRYEFPEHKESGNTSRVITKLSMTKNGTLWVATHDRIHRYHAETDTFDSQLIVLKKAIKAMVEGDDGTLWLAGFGFGLLAFDQETMQVKAHYLQNPKPITAYTVAQANDTSKLWIATPDGILLFNTKSKQVEQRFAQISRANGIDSVDNILQDRRGFVWVSSTSGLYKLNPTNGDVSHYAAKYQRPNGIKSRMVRALLEDHQGRLWIGTDKRGLHVYRPETDDFAHYPSSETDERFLPVDPIRDIFQDDEGNIWLTLNSFGIRKFNLELGKFQSFFSAQDDPNTLSSNNIWDMHESDNGIIWIATDGAGINRYDPKNHTVKRYRHEVGNPNSLSSDAVLSIDEDSQGNLWLGTWAGGLNFFNTKTEQFTRYERRPELPLTQTLGSHHVLNVHVAADDKIMISSWGFGLQVLNPTTGVFTNYAPHAGQYRLGNSELFKIRSITPHTEPNIYWLGGFGGAERFDLSSSKAEKVTAIGTNLVNSVYVESAERVWLATQEGLFEYFTNTKTAHQYDLSDDWPSNTIRTLEADQKNRLWLGTRSGLATFDKASHEVEFFDTGDGLTGENFNLFSHLKTQNGKMYFGTSAGLNRFHPDNLPRSKEPPPLKITQLQLGQSAITPQNSDYLSLAIDHTEAVSLPYSESDLSIEFAALSFIYPKKNQYRYRLKGFEADWIEADSEQRHVRYTNLPHGRYVFEVEASNNDGVWTEQPTQLQITIEPPWWALWWVRTLFLLLGMAVIYGLTTLRVWHSKRREQQLNAIVASRTSELRAAKNKVETLNQELEQRVADRTQALSREVMERRNAQERLYHLAYHDVLTGLPNRSWLLSRLNQIMDNSDHESIGVIFLDGDRFKRINDTYGHLVGDELLNAAALRLRNVLAKDQTAIRLGGDEFVVLVEKRATIGSMRLLADAIIGAFSEAFAIRNYVFDFQVSVGVALCDRSYTKAEECLRDADIAMYEAKQLGRGNYQFFNNNMRERELAQNQLEADLKQAIQANQFRIEYAPIINTQTKHLESFEVVLSWQHPDHGVLNVEQLFALAEDNGQAYDIGVWLFENVCLQLASWQAHLGTGYMPRVVIPASTTQINVQGLVDHLIYIATQCGIKPEQILLELSETVLFDGNTASLKHLQRLQDHGFDIVIDHFGSGHGALTHLHELPINRVKLDGELLERITECDKSSLYEVTKATTTLCQNLDISVVASGVENPEQWLLAQRLNCHLIQGAIIGEPMRTSDATRFIVDQKSSAAMSTNGH